MTGTSREPIETLHLTVYNEVVQRENHSFVAGVEHAIAVLSLLDAQAAERLDALLTDNLFPEVVDDHE